MDVEADLAAAAQAHQEAEHRVQEAAMAALRHKVRNEHPDAVYFSMVDSDQGPHLSGGSVFDSAGIELDEEFFDDGLGSWFVDDGYWQAHVVPFTSKPQALQRDQDQYGLRFLFKVNAED